MTVLFKKLSMYLDNEQPIQFRLKLSHLVLRHLVWLLSWEMITF